MKLRFAFALIVLTLITPTASAALKVIASKPAVTVDLTTGSGDQIFDFSINSAGVAVVGTVENGLANLLSTPTIGGSDGFISLLDRTKMRIWDLRLGSANDDIATAIARDTSGNFWVVGSSSKPEEISPSPTSDPLVLNLDNVLLDPVTIPKNTLNRLMVWKVSASGELVGSYFYDTDGLVVPKQISIRASGFRVTGDLTKESITSKFQIDLDANGIFTGLTANKVVAKKAQTITVIKAGSNNLKSFISKTTIIDIPSWRAKKATPVIVKYTKSGKALAANSFTGKIVKILWQSGVGAGVLVDVKGELELHILTNMA